MNAVVGDIFINPCCSDDSCKTGIVLSINFDRCSATAGGKETDTDSESSGVKKGKSATDGTVLPVSTDNTSCCFTR